jgi:hypothetical protein
MSEMILLIDYENVQKVDLSKLPSDALVRVFVGVLQKKVPTLLARQAQVLGPRLEWIQMEGQGSNALDFHIAHYLGRFVLEHPKARHVILSKDKGFDPLVKHLNGQGYTCERIGQLAGLPKAGPVKAEKPALPRAAAPRVTKSAPPKAPLRQQPRTTLAPTRTKAAAPDANVKRVADMLRKLDKKRLPARHASLAAYIGGAFQKKLSEAEVERIIKALAAASIVTEANKKLTYKL